MAACLGHSHFIFYKFIQYTSANIEINTNLKTSTYACDELTYNMLTFFVIRFFFFRYSIFGWMTASIETRLVVCICELARSSGEHCVKNVNFIYLSYCFIYRMSVWTCSCAFQIFFCLYALASYIPLHFTLQEKHMIRITRPYILYYTLFSWNMWLIDVLIILNILRSSQSGNICILFPVS